MLGWTEEDLELYEELKGVFEKLNWKTTRRNRKGKLYITVTHTGTKGMGAIHINENVYWGNPFKLIGDITRSFFPIARTTSGSTSPGGSITLRIND